MKINITTILAGFIIGIFTYDLNADNKILMGMPAYQVSWISTCSGAFAGAVLISIFSKIKTLNVALLFFAGILISIMIRMVYDIAFTKTEHHLAPLELIIYSIFSLPFALAGAYLGEFIRRRKQN